MALAFRRPAVSVLLGLLLFAGPAARTVTSGDVESLSADDVGVSSEESDRYILARVSRVIDGDTIRVRPAPGKVATAAGLAREEKVRFIGVDTPEVSGRAEPYGREAADFTWVWLEGRTVFLELDVDPRDRYGRLLAYIWLREPVDEEHDLESAMFNAVLLDKGYAQVMTVPPNVKYVERFVALQQEAREAERGLWGSR